MGALDFVIGILLVAAGIKGVLFNKQLTWSSPKDIPEWVEKRCTAQDVY